MKILIDADGRPVTELAVKLANTHKIKALIFCDTSHEFAIDGAEVITVSKGRGQCRFCACEQGRNRRHCYNAGLRTCGDGTCQKSDGYNAKRADNKRF